MTTKIAVLSFILALIAQWVAPAAQAAITNRPGATNLITYNASNKDATVLLKLSGGTVGDGCPNSVRYLRLVDVATGKTVTLTPFTSDQTGWYILKRGARVQVLNMLKNPYNGQQSSCLQGINITFNATFTCPDSLGGNNIVPITKTGPSFNLITSPNPPLPNGSNAFEASFNMPGTVGGVFNTGALNESADISCVNGANSTIVATFTPPAAGPYWATLAKTGTVKLTKAFTTRNSWVDVAHQCDANCVDPATGFARPGVFPFGCTQCNAFPDVAPPCGGQQYCAARNGAIGNTGCLFSRSPKNVQAGSQPPQPTFGGTVLVTYMGPLSPPGTCPPGTKQ